MSNAMETQFWIEFIDIFRENPCLWDTKCADYTNQSKRNLAFGILVEKLWDINEMADIDTVRKKIGSFRSSFRRELGRIKASEKSGAKKIYEPKWCYYPYLTFMASQDLSSAIEDEDLHDAGSDSIDAPENVQEVDSKQLETPQINPSIKSNTRNATVTVKSVAEKLSSTPPPQKKMKVQLPTNVKPSTNVTTDKDWPDDSSTFFEHLKAKMRSFDPQQKCIAQKLISDVMFKAETKQLQLTSKVVDYPQHYTSNPGIQDDTNSNSL